MKRSLLLLPIFLGLAIISPSLRADEATDKKQRIADSVVQSAKYTDTLTDLKRQEVAMQKAGYNFQTDQRIHKESLYALVGRAQEYMVQKKWEEARIDYSQAAYHSRLLFTDPDLGNRVAEFLVQQGSCLYETGQYSKALTAIDYAKMSPGWKGGDIYQFPIIIKINIALENFDEAIKNCVAFRDKINVLRVLTKNPTGFNSEEQTSYILESAAIYLKGDLAGARAKWQEIAKINPELAKVDLFDPFQAPFNLAIARNRSDTAARANRARYFSTLADKTRDKESPDELKGGLFNLFDTDQLVPQNFSFDQAALFDWNAALVVKKEPLFYVERAYSSRQFNKYSPDRKMAPSVILGDLEKAENSNVKDSTVMRRLGDYFKVVAYDSVKPDSINENGYRKAIHFYSIALLDNPDAETTLKLRWNIRSLSNDLLGDWRPIEARKPIIQPSAPLKTALQWKEFGNELRAKEELKSALAAYDKVLEIDPKFADAYNNKGNIYLNINAYGAALELFNKAIELDPQHRVAYINRASIWDAIGEPEKAIEDATKAVQFATTPLQKQLALTKRQAYYFDQRKLDLALADNAVLLQTAPDNSENLIIGAQMQLEQQPPNLDAAQKLLEKAIALKPTLGTPQLLLALTLHLRGNGTDELSPIAKAQLDKALTVASKEDLSWISTWLRSGRINRVLNTPQGNRINNFLKLINSGA